MLQNDVLRFCENKRLEDRISIDKLHEKAHTKFIVIRLTSGEANTGTDVQIV